MREILKIWSKIVGVTAVVYVILNLALHYGQNIGFALTDMLALGTEQWYWLLLQFGVMFAIGLGFPLAFPVFSWILLYFEARPVSDLMLSILESKFSYLSYLFVTPAVFPIAVDGFMAQVAGLLLGMLIARRLFPYSIRIVRRLLP